MYEVAGEPSAGFLNSDTSLEPRGFAVLVEPEPVSERTESGLFRPEVAREKLAHASQKGKLLAIGPNAWKAFDNGAPWAAVGDTVVFIKYAGVTIEHEGRQYRFLKDEDIIGVMRK